MTVLVQFGKKFELDLSSTCLLELFATEFLVKLIYQFLYLIYMVICSLDALKKTSRKKEMRRKRDIVEVLQQASYRRKRIGKLEIGMIKFLALILYLLARTTLTLIWSSTIIGCFKKVDFQGLNLVIWNFELPYAFLYVWFELFEK